MKKIIIILFAAILMDSCEKAYIPTDERLFPGADITAPVINSVTPANNDLSVATGAAISVIFSEAMEASTVNPQTFVLKQGDSPVTGTVSLSGSTATFKPAGPLLAGTAYTVSITTGAKDVSGNNLAADYNWGFTTVEGPDITAPSVSSVIPANNMTSVATSAGAVVTFSEPLNAATVSSTAIYLKKGTTLIAGSLSYAGTTATFVPAAALEPNTVYTGTVTTGITDIAGNKLQANYSWSFTTAALVDVTPPSILSVVPLGNSVSVALNAKPSITFNEPLDAQTVTASTFTLKQGTVPVSGTVTYSGTSATFTPSASLTGNTVYTASVTTGIKDVAGNSLSTAYSWNFTTVAAPSGVSFSGEVVPILNICNTCHKHGWTPSATASVFYTNLVSGGYVVPSAPETSKIYKKLSGGHPGSTVTTTQVNTILKWMTEGSKNN